MMSWQTVPLDSALLMALVKNRKAKEDIRTHKLEVNVKVAKNKSDHLDSVKTDCVYDLLRSFDDLNLDLFWQCNRS